MKINKKSPKHWFYLVKSGTYVLLSIAIRPLRYRDKKIITFYGHKYNGNLKAFAEYCISKKEYTVCYAALDPVYYKELSQEESKGIEVLSLSRFRDVIKISRSDVIISDRRAHALLYYMWLTDIPFIDVWHGIQVFKRFTPKDMAMLKKYQEIWTSSPSLKEVYVKDYRISEDKIKVTGYGRVDALVNNTYSPEHIREKYMIENSFDKIALFAPTWQQDNPKRQIIPFGENPSTFLSSINNIAKSNNALVIFRAHLNTNNQNRSQLTSMNNVRLMSHNEYPQTEEFLAISDILIADWSSISYDYLPLHRPTIFLDVPIPFKYGLTFDESYRYGEVVRSLQSLSVSLEKYMKNPEEFMRRYSDSIKRAEHVAYGNTLDGMSCERYYEQLKNILESK